MTTASDLVRLIEDGNKLSQIADLTTLHKGHVVKVAREHGYVLNVSTDRFQRAAVPTPLAAVKRPETGADAEQGKADVRPATRDLIDEGKASSVARVRRAADKAQAALDALAAALEDTRLAEAAKRAAAAEKEAARRKVAALERQLAEAKAALRGKPAPAPTAATDPKAVRAWAAANGIDCPTRGKVPAAVVDAYLAAVAA
jgi:hypothetical protein